MLSSRERGSLYLRLGLRLVLVAVVITVLCLLFRPAISLLGPFLFALLVAWMLNPLIRALNRKLATSRRFLAYIVVFLLLAAAVTGIVFIMYKLIAELFNLARNWQTIYDSMQPVMDRLSNLYAGLSNYLPEEISVIFDNLGETIGTWLKTSLEQMSTAFLTAAGNLASRVANGVLAFVVFVAASFFVSADYPRIRWKFRRSLDNSHFSRTLQEAAGSAFGGYLKAQIILSFTVGLIVLIALLIWRQNYALMISLLTALIDFIPFFGSGIILIPWAVVSLLTGATTKGIFLLALSLVCFLFRKLAEPKILGNHTGLSPLMSLISIYVGMKLAGVVGMILMPVLFMVVITMYRVDAFADTVCDVKTAILDVRSILKVPQTQKDMLKKRTEDANGKEKE